MELDFKKLQKLINFCRKNHIDHVKFEQFEFHITPAGFDQISNYKKNKMISDDSAIESEIPSYSSEDILFWSSGVIPETQEGVTNA